MTSRSIRRVRNALTEGGETVSLFRCDRILDFYCGCTSLGTAFLIVKLEWQSPQTLGENPRPVLVATLCFFHLLVYWVNFFHSIKFSGTEYFSILQFWLVILLALGAVMYPISLEAWIEEEERTLYYCLNLYMIAVIGIFNLLTSAEGGNDLFVAYMKGVALVGVVYYLVAVILFLAGLEAEFLMWVAPFFFMFPLGGPKTEDKMTTEDTARLTGFYSSETGEDSQYTTSMRNTEHDKVTVLGEPLRQPWHDDNTKTNEPQRTVVKRSIGQILGGAYHILRTGSLRGDIYSALDRDRVLDFYDSCYGLGAVFLIVELGWERALNFKEDAEPVLVAALCFFHLMVYWINLHHFLKFFEGDFALVQVWVLVFMSLGIVCYPIALMGWLDGDNRSVYYVSNIYLCLCLAIMSYITPIGPQANLLYRIYYRIGPSAAVVWYSLAWGLWYEVGGKSQAMIWIAPFLFACPLGGAKQQTDIPVEAEVEEIKDGWYPAGQIDKQHMDIPMEAELEEINDRWFPGGQIDKELEEQLREDELFTDSVSV